MKPLYFSYFPGTGVKSLITSLSLCNGVFYSNKNCAISQMKSARGKRTYEFTRQKLLNCSLETVPKFNNRHNWSYFENHNIIKGGDSAEIDDFKLSDIRSRNVLDKYDWYFPLVTHNASNYNAYNNFLKSGLAIKVIPDFNFVDLAIRLKWAPNGNCPIPSFSKQLFDEWLKDTKDIPFRYVIENFNPLNDSFYAELNKLAQQLYLDVNQSDIEQYVNKYRQFHFTIPDNYPDKDRLVELLRLVSAPN